MLIHGFNSLSVKESVKELDLSNIFSKIKIDYTDQWDILQTNYVKLKALHDFMSSSNFFLIEKVVEFMDSIDKMTKIYLESINFNETESCFKLECQLVGDLLQSSLTEKYHLKKISIVLKAYEILIIIVQEIIDQKFNMTIDPCFIKQFHKKIKI